MHAMATSSVMGPVVVLGQIQRVGVVVLHLGVVRRRGRHVAVHGRLLLVPGDAETSSGGDDHVKGHAEDAGGPRRRADLGPAGPRLFGHDQLHDEAVRDGQAGGRVDVADRVRVRLDRGLELHLDLAVAGVEVRLPAALELVPADGADVLMQHALALAADLVAVLCAGRRDHLGTLVDAPVEFPHPPSRAALLSSLDGSIHSELDGEFTNGMNDRRYDYVRRDVCGWKYAGR